MNYKLNRNILIALLAIVALCAGCKRANIPHPNQLNSFDGYAYDTLIICKAALTEAKAHAAEYPQYKAELNQAIASYNAAESAYKTWRSAKLSGVDSQEDMLALKEQLSGVAAQVRMVMKLFGLKIEEIVGGGL